MFNDVFWFSTIVALIGPTSLVAVGIALPASPGVARPVNPSGHRRMRLRRVLVVH